MHAVDDPRARPPEFQRSTGGIQTSRDLPGFTPGPYGQEGSCGGRLPVWAAAAGRGVLGQSFRTGGPHAGH